MSHHMSILTMKLSIFHIFYGFEYLNQGKTPLKFIPDTPRVWWWIRYPLYHISIFDVFSVEDPNTCNLIWCEWMRWGARGVGGTQTQQ